MIRNKIVAKILTNLFLIGFLGYLSGKFVHKFTEDNLWLGFNYYFFISIFILVSLLIINNYLWFTIMSVVLILGSVLFLYFKVNPAEAIVEANNIEANNGSIFGSMKQNPTNFSLFFWVMFTASAVTIIGIIIARKVYNKMKLKEGKIGDKGEDGQRGDEGGVSPILNSPGEICYQQLLLHCDKILSEIKKERNIPFDDADTHLKNLHFKEELKRIAHSQEFKTEIFKLLKCKLGCKTNSQIKKVYCKNKNRFMALIIIKIKNDLTQWIRRMCMYKKGLVYLSMEMSLPKDWETLYLTGDKEIGLKPNPYDHFPPLSTIWGCGEISSFNGSSCCKTSGSDTGTETDSGVRASSTFNNDTTSSASNSCILSFDSTLEESDAFVPTDYINTNNDKSTNSNDNRTWNWGSV